MAESTTYSEFMKKIREFLAKGNELTKENEDRLKMLNDMYKILESDRETGEKTTEAKKFKDIADKLFENVLFEYFIKLATAATTSSLVREMESKQKEDKSAKLTEAMKIKVGEIKHYLAKAKEQMVKIDEILPPLLKKVRDAKTKRFKITEEEIIGLELDVEDVEGELEDFKKYLEDGNRTIKLLESDVKLELLKYGITIVAIASGASAVIMIGGVAVCSTTMVAEASFIPLLGQKLLSGASGTVSLIAGGLATVCLLVSFAGLIKSYKESLSVQLEKLKSEMRKITTEYETRQKKIEKRVTERMKR